MFVWALPVIWAAGTAWTAVYALRPPYRAESVGWVYSYGFSTPEDLGSGAQRRWVMHRGVGVVPSVGNRLVLTFRAAPETAAAGSIGLRVFTREGTLIDQPLAGSETVTANVDFAGRRWTMVQIETSRRGVVVDGFERALEVTTRIE